MRAQSRPNVQAGQDLIEYALVLPFLLTLTLALVELALVIYQYNAVANAARKGARAGIIAIGGESTGAFALQAASSMLRE